MGGRTRLDLITGIRDPRDDAEMSGVRPRGAGWNAALDDQAARDRSMLTRELVHRA